MVGAPEERADLAGADIGVGGDDAGDRMAGDAKDTARACANVSNVRRSMLVTRLPKRSTSSTTPVRVASLDLRDAACRVGDTP